MNTARLVGTTSFVTGLEPEAAIVYMARVSSPKNQDNRDSDAKLLRFLVKNGHWSPFDMVDMILQIHTSRAIMAQILRHWSFRFQEFSQRYAHVQGEDYTHVEIRLKADGGNRQGSAESSDELTGIAQDWCACSKDTYDSLIERGAAPESARMVLPLSTPTTAYMKASVRSWMTYFWQRLDAHAQKEHRELAQQMFAIFKENFPITADLVEHGRIMYIHEGE